VLLTNPKTIVFYCPLSSEIRIVEILAVSNPNKERKFVERELALCFNLDSLNFNGNQRAVHVNLLFFL